MNGEIWKPIVGYEGLYEVSNKGRVHSLPRMVHYNSGYEKRNNGKILTPSKASKYKNCDYYRVSLSKDNKAKAIPVHRLVAEHFIQRKEGCNFVNHIDGNKHNNSADNLEWVTSKGNKLHTVYTGLDIPYFGIKKVYCITNGEVYPSASFAARKLGLLDTSIAKVCRGRYKHTGGMVFRYV